MKLAEALTRVVRTKENDGGCEIEALMNALHLDRMPDWDAVETRLYGYWISRWFCSDTFVGCKALYLDDTLVGYTTQDARKSPVEVKFIDVAQAEAVREWMIACADAPPETPPLATAHDLDIEIGIDFGVRYTGEILDRQGYYRGARADFVAAGNPRDYIDRTLKVLTETGENTITVADFRTPYHLEGQWPLHPLPSETL